MRRLQWVEHLAGVLPQMREPFVTSQRALADFLQLHVLEDIFWLVERAKEDKEELLSLLGIQARDMYYC